MTNIKFSICIYIFPYIYFFYIYIILLYIFLFLIYIKKKPYIYKNPIYIKKKKKSLKLYELIHCKKVKFCEQKHKSRTRQKRGHALGKHWCRGPGRNNTGPGVDSHPTRAVARTGLARTGLVRNSCPAVRT